MVEDLVRKAVEIYNRYRAPEAFAEVIDIDNTEGVVYMKFSGHFCVTCGVIDWIEDYIYILKDLGVDAEISRVKYFTEENYVLVEVKIYSIDK